MNSDTKHEDTAEPAPELKPVGTQTPAAQEPRNIAETYDRAVNLLKTEDQNVVATLVALIDVGRNDQNWGEHHNTSALDIVREKQRYAHAEKMAEIAANESVEVARVRPWILGLVIVGVLSLAWLCLNFGQPQYIAAIVTAAGGYGIGFDRGKNHATTRPRKPKNGSVSS